ncbi:hypothetical protein [Bartonella quintana]|nr:hypothetical protein [Bartonella quintana]
MARVFPYLQESGVSFMHPWQGRSIPKRDEFLVSERGSVRF